MLFPKGTSHNQSLHNPLNHTLSLFHSLSRRTYSLTDTHSLMINNCSRSLKLPPACQIQPPWNSCEFSVARAVPSVQKACFYGELGVQCGITRGAIDCSVAHNHGLAEGTRYMGTVIQEDGVCSHWLILGHSEGSAVQCLQQ